MRTAMRYDELRLVWTSLPITQAGEKMAKYEKKRSARRSTPRRPITMASTAEPPDPIPCALAAILLPASHEPGCSSWCTFKDSIGVRSSGNLCVEYV